MKVKKTFNNNAVLTIHGNDEIIVTGNGIGYKLREGDEVNESLIEKTFVLNDSKKQRYFDLFTGDKSYYDTAQKIIDLAQKCLGVELYEQSAIELADHICFVVRRIRAGEYIAFAINDETMSVYPKEYEIGLEAIRLIQNTYGIKLPVDEAGFIAFHVILAEKENCSANPYKLISFVNSILQILDSYYPEISENRNSFTYSRMVMHLRFLGNRILQRETLNNSEVSILMKVYEKNNKLRRCINEIDRYIRKQYNWDLSDEEKTYIMIHICRLCND